MDGVLRGASTHRAPGQNKKLHSNPATQHPTAMKLQNPSMRFYRYRVLCCFAGFELELSTRVTPPRDQLHTKHVLLQSRSRKHKKVASRQSTSHNKGVRRGRKFNVLGGNNFGAWLMGKTYPMVAVRLAAPMFSKQICRCQPHGIRDPTHLNGLVLNGDEVE